MDTAIGERRLTLLRRKLRGSVTSGELLPPSQIFVVSLENLCQFAFNALP